MSETVRFTFEGKPLEGRHGESLAATLVSTGIVGFRETRGGEMRGMFCGMGVCQDCLLEVDGKPNQRACMTRLEGPTTVRPGIYGRALPEVASGEPPKLKCSLGRRYRLHHARGTGPALVDHRPI